MTSRPRPRINRGFTLLEVMIVIVLMSMVASLTMISLGAADQTARTMAIISQVKDLDARGRLLAQTSGVSTSLVHEDRRISLATVPVNDAPEIISDIELVNVTVHLSAEKPLQRIVFDRRGHSDDYMFTMSAGENETSRQWEVHGLTGAFSEVSP